MRERFTPSADAKARPPPTIALAAYPGTSNRIETVTRGAQTVRVLAYDAAGNITSDARSGSTYAYTYNAAGRLKTVSYEGNLKGTYTYDGLEQLITRVITNSGTLDGTIHTVHDRSGNVIAEIYAGGQTVREYLWLPEGGYAGTDLPLAVVDGVNTAWPVLYYVHADHLGRPIRMTDAAKAAVWQATFQPWGAPQQITGSLVLNQRFPGQWFQLESGLHYNWHRHYDPSLGRYTQPDPLGFVDGPGVYGYAGGNPEDDVDFEGLFQMCHRPLQNIGFTGYRHCYIGFEDGTTLGFGPDGVHPDPDPNHPRTQCTERERPDLDECLRREMMTCANYSVSSNNCCHCVRRALAACRADVPPQSFPNNWPFN